MKKYIKHIIPFALSLLAYGLSFSQQSKIDSLENLLKKAKEDTNKVNTIFKLYELCANDSIGLKYAHIALVLSEKIKYDYGSINSLKCIGRSNYFLGKYDTSFKYIANVIKQADAKGYKNILAYSYKIMGYLYAPNSSNVAKEYYEKSLNICKEIKDTSLMADNYSAIGVFYESRKNYQKALECFLISLKLREKIGDPGVAESLFEASRMYEKVGMYDKEIELRQKGLIIAEERGDTKALVVGLLLVGHTYFDRKKEYSKALPYYLKAYALSQKINFIEGVSVAQKIGFIYKTQGKFQKSLEYYEIACLFYKDLRYMDNGKGLADMKHDFEAEKEKQKLLIKDSEIAKQKAETEKQVLQRNAFMIGFVLVVLLIFFVFRSYHQKQKANEIISEQKKMVEEKNKDISDSINYAKRIQEAILAPKELKYKLFPDAFVLYQPKDVVSGDFYWFEEKNGKRLIAAVDCTGHGVPGAFMSMIGNSFLNEIVNERGIIQPNLILSELRHSVIRALKQSDKDDGSKDGMDISLLSFDDKNNTVEFAGANNPFWIVSKGECIEYKADKRPIGYFQGKELPFTNHIVELSKGDSLYVFSDGYADQFGGPKGKKFKYRQLQEMLISIQNEPMMKQEEILLATFNKWKGNLEQVDDVLVIGIRI